ncbi:MAG: PKD domain-containing protein [bacterium]|nr:PKD domain-containing protein [bacterium]
MLTLILKVGGQIAITPSAGCMPAGLLNANFSFSGGNATNIVWNFGDGSPNSNVNPSQHSYLNPGTFNVVFTAVLNGQTITYTATARVSQQPTGSFGFQLPASHCIPMSVPFSASSPNTGVNYTWDFGDNTLGGGQNPGHVYTSAGSFTPILTVQDPGTGCFKNIISAPIRASALPIIQLNISPGNFTCAASFAPAFDASGSTSGSPLGGGLTFSWNFGNSQSSGLPTPGVILYSPQGVYNVNLTVTDNNQCSSSTVTAISLVSPTLNAVVPGTVCIYGQYPVPPGIQYFGITIQSSQPVTTWNLVGRYTKTSPYVPLTSGTQIGSDTLMGWNTPGLHTIIVTANAGQCQAVQTKTMWVEQVVPEFTFTPIGFTCNPTLTASYVNQSTINSSSSLNYTWTAPLWNGAPTLTSTSTNPTFTYTQGSLNPYTIFFTYAPMVNLHVKSNPRGCWADISHIFDTIQKPSAFFKVDKAEGCVPLSVKFMDSSWTFKSTAPVNGYTNSITSYTWYSGAGPTLSGTLAPPPASNSAIPIYLYTYTAVGVYSPSLSIQTKMGCPSTSFVGTITVVDPPIISYALPSGNVCAGQPFQFTLSAGTSGPVQHWHVDTDNGFFSACVSNATPSGIFTHLGPHNFTITAYKNSCMSSTVGSQVINVIGPLVKAWYKINCSSKTIDFNYNVRDASSASIDYGEGLGSVVLPVDTSGFITHTYANTGDYTVTLKAFNSGNGCPPFTQTLSVHVRNLTSSFTLTPVICKNSRISPNSTGCTDVLVGGGKTYIWLFDNLPPEYTTAQLYLSNAVFTVVGIHTASLLVKDQNGCVAISSQSFRVSEPSPNFTFNANPICVSNYPLVMINQTPQIPDPVSNYTWSVLSGTILLSTIVGTTPAHSPTYALIPIGSQSRTLQIICTALNSISCTASYSNIITINDPSINFSATSPGMCIPGPPVQFNVNAAPSHTLYQINWGDQTNTSNPTWTTSSTYTLSHQYLTTGIYTPTVTLTDNGGCSKALILSNVYVQAPVAPTFTFFNIKSPATTGSLFCMPVTLSVTSTSDSLLFPLQYNWHSGKPGVNWNVSSSFVSGATYTNTGIYNYSLMLVTIPSGCTSLFSKSLQIDDPQIDFVIEPDNERTTYCLGDPITMRVTNTKGSGYWDWDFGDGNSRGPFTNPAFQSVLVYENTYFPESTNGMLTFQVVGRVFGNIQCKDFKRRTLNIIRAFPDFKRNEDLLIIDYKHCLGKTENFTNLSTTNGGPLTYTWNFGNGATATSTNAVYQYPDPGRFG